MASKIVSESQKLLTPVPAPAKFQVCNPLGSSRKISWHCCYLLRCAQCTRRVLLLPNIISEGSFWTGSWCWCLGMMHFLYLLIKDKNLFGVWTDNLGAQSLACFHESFNILQIVLMETTLQLLSRSPLSKSYIQIISLRHFSQQRFFKLRIWFVYLSLFFSQV